MLTVPDAAKRVRRNPETVRRWIRSGRLRSQKVGTQHLVDERELRPYRGRTANAAAAEGVAPDRVRQAAAERRAHRSRGARGPRGPLTLVLDASLLFVSCTSADGFAPFGRERLVGPPLLWPETRSALHQAAWRGELSDGDARDALRRLRDGPVRPRDHPRLGEEAWRIAAHTRAVRAAQRPSARARCRAALRCRRALPGTRRGRNRVSCDAVFAPKLLAFEQATPLSWGASFRATPSPGCAPTRARSTATRMP